MQKDLVHSPERVHQGDFVRKLPEGVTHADQTCVTRRHAPQPVDAFVCAGPSRPCKPAAARPLDCTAVSARGKSHFMAVLNLLLAGNTQARVTPELVEELARNNWTSGCKFLLVPLVVGHDIG